MKSLVPRHGSCEGVSTPVEARAEPLQVVLRIVVLRAAHSALHDELALLQGQRVVQTQLVRRLAIATAHARLHMLTKRLLSRRPSQRACH